MEDECKDIQCMEAETLRETFPDEFKEQSNCKWSLRVECEDRAYKMGMTMVLKLPTDYPMSPVEIQLFPFGRKASSYIISFLSEKLYNLAKEGVGQPMIFALYDLLKSQLINLEDNLSMGEFSFLPKDVLFEIFKILDNVSLGKIAILNLGLKQLIDNPFFWKDRCRTLYPLEVERKGEIKDWKDEYLKLAKITLCPSILYNNYGISILERIGTGDSWSPNIDWKHAFKEELQQTAQVILTSESNPYQGNILNASDKTFIGAYSLMEEMQKMSSIKRNRISKMNIWNCRYLGREIGWFVFTLYPTPYNEKLLNCLVKVCRGVFLQFNSKFFTPVPCVVYYPVFCYINRLTKNNKHTIAHISINRKKTPGFFEFLTKYPSPTQYSRHLQNAFLKETASTKSNEMWTNNKKEWRNIVGWFWIFSTLLTKDMYQAAQLDHHWKEADSFWLSQMNKTDGNILNSLK